VDKQFNQYLLRFQQKKRGGEAIKPAVIIKKKDYSDAETPYRERQLGLAQISYQTPQSLLALP